MKDYISQLKKAREASQKIRSANGEAKNIFLEKLSELLLKNKKKVLAENQKDIKEASNITEAMKKRLLLNEGALKSMAKGLLEIKNDSDPVGNIEEMRKMENGMKVGRVRVPIGVILFVYESRPNVIIDAAALCLKSGNALIARGGKEANNSNQALLSQIQEALEFAGLPRESIQLLEDRSYETFDKVLKENKYIDLIVPRGREKLIKRVKENSQIPVIAHERGLTHAYIDKEADIEKAIKICLNSKTSNPSTCNSLEKILIHKDVYEKVAPRLLEEFLKNQVEVRGCKKICALNSKCLEASEEDWDTEYLDLIIAIKVVDSYEEALNHIEKHSSGLVDVIITQNYSRAQNFLDQVNSAAVIVNAASRLVDGGQFGLGAELGISTSSIHMRGPMGLKDLTVSKYIVLGEGQIRQ